MTAKVFAPALALVMAMAWSTALACPGDDHGHAGYKSAASGSTAVAGYSNTVELDTQRNAEYRTYQGPDSSMTYADGEWSGRWIAGEWTPGYWHNGTWRAAEFNNGNWVVRSSSNGEWTTYTLSDVEWQSMPEGRVMGYSDSKAGHGGHMAEGERCYHDGSAGHHGKSHGHGCGCPCRDGWYDCWGVWQTDDMYDFEAIRESDYDPVMGRGDTGRGWFW